MLNFNGVLISSAAAGSSVQPNTHYRGVSYGVPWPLSCSGSVSVDNSSDVDLVSTLNGMTGGVMPDGTFPPSVIPDLNFIGEYIKRCHTQNVRVRALLCATECQWPLLDAATARVLLRHAFRLGFDYAYGCCDFSALYSDMNPPPPGELAAIATNLNDFGLFDTYSTFLNYISVRQQFCKTAGETMAKDGAFSFRCTPLEDSGDFLMFDVYEIDWPAVHVSTGG